MRFGLDDWVVVYYLLCGDLFAPIYPYFLSCTKAQQGLSQATVSHFGNTNYFPYVRKQLFSADINLQDHVVIHASKYWRKTGVLLIQQFERPFSPKQCKNCLLFIKQIKSQTIFH